VAASGAAATSKPAGEPRWPAIVAYLALGALNVILPDELSPGPYWLLLAVVAVLLIPTVISHRAGQRHINAILSYVILSAVTVSMIISLVLMVLGILSKKEPPVILLRAAGALWVANVLVFASWYWKLDAGGPNLRDTRTTHTEGAFLFPQMLLSGKQARNWSPGFVDYLFLAFNTSTAFSPTDVPVLSRWAKLMMIVQASISLTTVVLIAARAVNIL